MNIERLTVLRDHIANLPSTRFDMGSFCTGHPISLGIDLSDNCGTAGCIAGWACALFAPDKVISLQRAEALLGLTWEQADALFYPLHMNQPASVAAAVLTNLIETGAVTWPT